MLQGATRNRTVPCALEQPLVDGSRLFLVACEEQEVIRLVGALLAEQNDEWAVARRYMSADSITKALAPPADEPEEVIAIAAAA